MYAAALDVAGANAREIWGVQWVKLLGVPYRFLYPSALFFICIGVYTAHNDFFDVTERLPEATLEFPHLPLGDGTGLYYTTTSSAGFLRRTFDSASPLPNSPLQPRTIRPIAATIVKI